jgi:RNA polymerase sigma-70 factor, ECF subfamily
MIVARVAESSMSVAAAALWHGLASRPAHAGELETVAAAAWQRAREAHPAIEVAAEAFFAFVGPRIGDASELERRQVADLFLACGCDHGDAAALATLEQVTLPAVERGLGGLGLTAEGRRDLMQILRERMLVVRIGEATRGIAAYDGRAPLAIWLRVCAARIGMREANRERRNVELDDRQLEQLAPGVPDPELAYLQRVYGDQFRTAFTEAVASLPPRERNLLRHAVLDELGIDQLAAIYHVHRATAARQLKAARANLIEATRERMRVALGVSATELESIMRMIQSLADMTLRKVLGRPPRKSE